MLVNVDCLSRRHILFALTLVASACSDGGNDDVKTNGGNLSTGGSAKGGATTAGGSTGSGGRTTSGSGGVSSGGKVSSGGQTSGGTTASGGVATGGTKSGGVVMGGSGSGGMSSGGTVKGGATAGGQGSGGVSSGGSSGTATGGATNSGGQPTQGGAGGSNRDAGTDSAPSGGCSVTGFHVKGTKIYDANCNEFIIRGVNYPYAWYTADVQKRFGDVASVRSNLVRVVMATGGQWTRTSAADVTNIISWAKSNKLIAMLEVHDSTGFSEKAQAVNPSQAVDYWVSNEISSVLKGTEAYVMINIANEAFGNNTTEQWEPFYVGAIPKLRNAGLHHLLVVDAPNWGQDWSYTMRDGGGPEKIFKADPEKNVVFSIHMYDVYNSASVVTDYFTKFLAKGLPLIVGEFAADHGPGKEIAEDSIMSLSQQKGVGYAGWSWSGNSSDLSSLDMTVNFSVNNLTTWGTRLLKGANGIGETGKVCSVFK